MGVTCRADVSENTPADVEAALDLNDEQRETVQAMYEHLSRVMSSVENEVGPIPLSSVVRR